MKPANEVRITRDQQVLVDGINIPSVLRCEASMNPDLETSVTIYVYAGRIAIQGYTAYEDFQPDGSAGIEELLVTEDGRALINGIEIPGAKSVNVIADPLTDPEVSIRVCTRKITIPNFTVLPGSSFRAWRTICWGRQSRIIPKISPGRRTTWTCSPHPMR